MRKMNTHRIDEKANCLKKNNAITSYSILDETMYKFQDSHNNKVHLHSTKRQAHGALQLIIEKKEYKCNYTHHYFSHRINHIGANKFLLPIG